MNPAGLADAIEHVRAHPRLPVWDKAMRARVVAALSSPAPLALLVPIITEWEARFA